MHVVKKALAAASLAVTAVVAPFTAAPAAHATDCAGSVSFVSGTPSSTNTVVTEVVGTFDTVGPGYSHLHCDVGWISTCELYVNGDLVPAACNTHYTPEPDRCPATGSCGVDVRALITVLPGETANVTARLGMTWGCCGYIGGPEAIGTGSWTVTGSFGGILPDCEDLAGDLCKKFDPRVKVLIDDL